MITELNSDERIICIDESILCYDSISVKVWAKKGSKPIRMITGQHKKTFIFGAVTNKREQLFRQFKSMTHAEFLTFLYCLKYKFGKFILLLDKAPWHRDGKVQNYLYKNRESIHTIYFPPCSPELNPVEECWKQSKPEIAGNQIYDDFSSLKSAVTRYFKTHRFGLDINHYLCP